jgi:4-nitrophenyl phosphatase
MRLGWCIDIDGTLLKYQDPIDGAFEFLTQLQLKNIPFVLLSNTGCKSAHNVSILVKSLLQIDVVPGQIFTAHDNMLSEIHICSDFNYWVFVGEVDYRGDVKVLNMFEDFGKDTSDTCIAIFSDGEFFNYYETLAAVTNMAVRGATIWITSQDKTLVQKNKKVRPGPGAFIAAVLSMVPHAKVRSFGKGSNSILQMQKVFNQLCKQGFSGTTHDIVIVGDRFESDMMFGIENGAQTVLVESGCDSLSDDANFRKKIDMVANSVADVCPQFSNISQITKIQQKIRRYLRHTVQRTLVSLGDTTWANFSIITAFKKADDMFLATSPRRIKSVPTNLDQMK